LFADFVLYNGGFGTENVLSKINNLKMVNPGDSIKNSGPALINTHTHTHSSLDSDPVSAGTPILVAVVTVVVESCEEFSSQDNAPLRHRQSENMARAMQQPSPGPCEASRPPI
jgi:hypothetical protein